MLRAVQTEDLDTIQRVGVDSPSHALAAMSLLAFLRLADHDDEGAKAPLVAAFATGRNPANDPFIAKYVSAHVELRIADGVTAELALDRDSLGLALAELRQADGDKRDHQCR